MFWLSAAIAVAAVWNFQRTKIALRREMTTNDKVEQRGS